ncbi:AAA domain-containing protein [Salana multivorans]|uniref:AAA domain-containing protein n=1 Tax=Salana multivorans TaxID=120377 RepID=A0A3N2D7W1_9MICO|nr:AAA family ATPase [Salana multivorans]ROR95534.1 AAA domain-containing protein [Salana multivorans]
MFTASRALSRNISDGKELPRVPWLRDLYRYGCTPRHGQVVMVVGRSGSGKSALTMAWVQDMGLPTLYFSGDMSAFDASTRLASMVSGETVPMIEAAFDAGTQTEYVDALAESKVTFVFGAPITWQRVTDALEAYVELWDAYPEVLVIDNLMDLDGAESDYSVQMEAMSIVTELARETGATVFILHHASDKTMDAKNAPYDPPNRADVKGGLSEKPEISLSIALDPRRGTANVAVIKNRNGRSDPTARHFIEIGTEPELSRFHAL